MKKTVSMKRMMILALVMLLIAASLTACKKEPKESEQADQTDQTQDVADTTAPETEENEESSAEDSPATRPEAEGGVLHQAYDLSYCLPDWMEAMAYNGLMGVYEFYTGTFNGSPTGLDFATEVYSDAELKGETLETYVQTRSRAAKAGLTAFERVNYNGFEWLRLTNGSNATYYYAVFNEGLYCLLATQGADSAENYTTARDMLEQTLFFAVE